MLVLSRKKNESVVIDGTIEVMVVDIRGDKVRLGIKAPSDVSVHRREVQDSIDRNKLAAAQSAKAIGQPEETADKSVSV